MCIQTWHGFSAILGRRLRRPIINLGFSGNGRMEAEVVTLLAEQDPFVYVIDWFPNMNETTEHKLHSDQSLESQ